MFVPLFITILLLSSCDTLHNLFKGDKGDRGDKGDSGTTIVLPISDPALTVSTGTVTLNYDGTHIETYYNFKTGLTIHTTYYGSGRPSPEVEIRVKWDGSAGIWINPYTYDFGEVPLENVKKVSLSSLYGGSPVLRNQVYGLTVYNNTNAVKFKVTDLVPDNRITLDYVYQNKPYLYEFSW
jgi:hypothetical protein